MASTKIERVKGVNDVLSRDYKVTQQIQTTLTKAFESFGYSPLELPIIEHTELYLRKSGEDIIARMYDFNYRNRRLCLRPEMTASAVRAFIDNFQDTPLPLRVYYIGPVFRYEKPQRARYRQFTQIGIELIGASGAMADAEVICLARDGLNALGLANYRVVVGNIGILSRFLDSLGIENRLRNFLLLNMENLDKKGLEYISERLAEVYPAFKDYEDEDVSKQDPSRNQRSHKLVEFFQQMEESEARLAILDFLESINISMDEGEDQDEIIGRLLTKIRRKDQVPGLKQALQFMNDIAALKGKPDEVLEEASKILACYNIGQSPLDDLRDVIRILGFYDPDLQGIDLDLGLSRGLQYYTGTIFEIHHGSLGDERQICGGGRYDDLISTLGGIRNTPATGFSYGVERIHLALESEGKSPEIASFVDVLLIPVSSSDIRYAVRVAENLRKKGIRVELDVKNKGVKSGLQYADKKDIPFTAIVGSTEEAAEEVVLRDMNSRQEHRIPIKETAETITRASRHDA